MVQADFQLINGEQREKKEGRQRGWRGKSSRCRRLGRLWSAEKGDGVKQEGSELSITEKSSQVWNVGGHGFLKRREMN